MELKKQKSEPELRVELAAAYRLIDYWGLNEIIYNHISVRLPGDPPQFLINRFGLLYSEITASNLVKIDLEGNLIDPGQEKSKVRVNPAGFIIHSAIHDKREDAQCIVHTHTEAGIAVSSLRAGFVPFGQESMRFYNRVAYYEFNGIVLDPKEKDALIHSLRDKNVLILKNHGLLTLGASVPQAVFLMYYLERACRVQLAIQATGHEPIYPDPEICEKTAQQHWGKVEQLDNLMWPAMMRVLDAKDPSYKK